MAEPRAEVTRDLARLISRSTPSDIPPEAFHQARRSVLNWLGAALGGCRDASVAHALAMAGEFSGPPQATVIGHAARMDSLTAAMVNGISGNILDFDDTHAHIVLHPSASITCALFALSEIRPMHGRTLLHALVLGIELESRLLDPRTASYRFAWSPTTSVASLGAAAACAFALGLDERQVAWALGIAATQAGGLRETGGSMSKAFNAGNAARSGLAAALLAARGFTGATTAIEGPKGFIAAFGEARDPSSMVEAWGRQWQVLMNTFKPFPCGIVTHAVIDGCLQLHAEGVDPARIRSVRLAVHPMAMRLTGREAPSNPLEAKLSIFHVAAAALLRGRVGVKEFHPGCIADPSILQLRSRVGAKVDEGFATDEAEVSVVVDDGRTLVRHVDHAVGSLVRPMADATLEAKFIDLCDGVLPRPAADALAAQVWAIDRLPDASAVIRASAGFTGPGPLQ
ncbi:MAG: MmgE/PrpD family protein [bacterium]|jgi:2-methylcitrate dehydratase PrpD|nr:MmgE/PrpD family protein [Betaproteobacteria bacterium]